MKNKLILLVAYVSIIMILQEGSAGASTDFGFSFYLYFAPIWVIILSFLMKQPLDLKREETVIFKRILIVYSIIFIAQTLILFIFNSATLYGTFYWNIVKFTTPVITIILIASMPLNITKKQLLSSIDFIFFCAIAALIPKLMLFSPATFTLNDVVVEGNLPTESDVLCFVFGLITAHYIGQKNRKMFLSIFFVLLTGKRIVFLALLTLIFLNISFMKAIITKYYYMIVCLILMVNMAYAYMIYSIGGQTQSVIHAFEKATNRSLNHVTMGREMLYQSIVEKLKRPNIYGDGVGIVIFTLRKIDPTKEWLHSDILMNIYEVGILGTLIWLFVFYSNFRKHPFLLTLALLFNVFLLTDNTFYYFIPSFLFYYIIYVNIRLESLNTDNKIFFIKTEDLPLLENYRKKKRWSL